MYGLNLILNKSSESKKIFDLLPKVLFGAQIFFKTF